MLRETKMWKHGLGEKICFHELLLCHKVWITSILRPRLRQPLVIAPTKQRGLFANYLTMGEGASMRDPHYQLLFFSRGSQRWLSFVWLDGHAGFRFDLEWYTKCPQIRHGGQCSNIWNQKIWGNCFSQQLTWFKRIIQHSSDNPWSIDLVYRV